MESNSDMLHRKNRLMRAGRLEKAGALSRRIDQEITWCCKNRFSKIDNKTNARGMWAAVRQLTGRPQEAPIVPGVTAESLNDHYATISTDHSYTAPVCKQQSTPGTQSEYVTEWKIFKILDSLRPTATGLDGLSLVPPHWSSSAPVFARQIAMLFNLSLVTSSVPQQWKRARIKPIPKVADPKQHADFRPISITPIGNTHQNYGTNSYTQLHISSSCLSSAITVIR